MDPLSFYGRKIKNGNSDFENGIGINDDSSDEEDFSSGSDDNYICEDDSESDDESNSFEELPQIASTSRSSVQQEWSNVFEEAEKIPFIGKHGLNKRIVIEDGLPLPINIFEQFFDSEIFELMVLETNITTINKLTFLSSFITI